MRAKALLAKALLMTLVGLIMATVGEGALFNMPRFTMGIMDLQSGFGFITLAMAMFALPEALFLVLNPKRGAGAADGAADGVDRLRLAHDHLVQLVFQVEQPLGLFLLEARQRHAGHLGDDLGDLHKVSVCGGAVVHVVSSKKDG